MNQTKNTPEILLHQLAQKGAGIMVEKFSGNMLHTSSGFSEPHRHDYYTCLLLDKGRVETLVDFQKTIIHSNTIFISYPGQVHQVLTSTICSGWFLSFDSKLVEDAVRTALEQSLSEIITLDLCASDVLWFKQLIGLLFEQSDENHSILFNPYVQHSLLTAFIHQATMAFQAREQITTVHHSTRNVSITKEFKQQLRHHFKSFKRPADYADLLNISVSYLNDTVKHVTGFSVSYFIQQEIIKEAQRLLCYTDLSIKEIAISLGYEDFKYFNRFFRKITTVSPGSFRKNYLL